VPVQKAKGPPSAARGGILRALPYRSSRVKHGEMPAVLPVDGIPMPQRILLILDDALVAKAIVDALSHSNDESFEVEWVRHCSAGLERLDGVAAIVLDLYLPDSRGTETFERVFNVARNIPIMVLTSPQDENTARLAVQCGAQDYFFKSRVDAYPLRKAVAAMIERAVIAAALFEEKERAQVTLNSIGDAVISANVSGEVT
jgi:DNA-binding NarL/FixJ family response regulator